MSTLLYGSTRVAPASSQEHVRSTVTVVDKDETPAVETSAPEFNDAGTDPDTGGGLTTRQLASHVIPSERYVPNIGNAGEDLFSRVNDQVSSSGTAAAREAAGAWGHGTFKVVEGIEPTIREGGQLGADYFVASTRPDAGSSLTDGVTPAQPADADTIAAAAATGAANTRAAYGAFLAAATGSVK